MQAKKGCQPSRRNRLQEPVRLVAYVPQAPIVEERTAFDLLHTGKGFMLFNQWYYRMITRNTQTITAPPPCLGSTWSQAFCPRLGLHDFAFVEFIRTFVDCSDSEAFDLFDLLDYRLLGILEFRPVYLAICLVAALGSHQLTKFLYFHSSFFFNLLAEGSVATKSGCIALPRLITFLRILGAPTHLILRMIPTEGSEPMAQFRYEQFLEVSFLVMKELDQGSVFGASSVINEPDRSALTRSKVCTIQ